jgi:hypothetical protein
MSGPARQGCTLFLFRHSSASRRAVATVLSLLVVGLSPAGASAASHHQGPGPQSKAQKRAHARALARKRLARELRHNPKALLKPSFIRKAQIAEFDLPVTVRLNKSNDQTLTALSLQWSPAVFAPWPSAPAEQPVSPDPSTPDTVTSQLTGTFTMVIHFNRDTSGYGGLGTLETTQGAAVAMSGSAFPISDFATPCAPPQTALQVYQPSPDVPPVAFVSGGATSGILNLFNGRVAGELHLIAKLASTRVTACGATPFNTQVDSGGAVPLVVTYDGDLHVSPSITPDGHMRFGVITITAAQQSSFGYVHSCTVDPSTVTAPADQCVDAAYPLRLSFQKLTGEIVLGAIGS